MSESGGPDLLVRARAALLDALAVHRRAVVVIGAQAIYLHTGGVALALAETTKDTISLSTRALSATTRCSRTRCVRRGSSSTAEPVSPAFGSTVALLARELLEALE